MSIAAVAWMVLCLLCLTTDVSLADDPAATASSANVGGTAYTSTDGQWSVTLPAGWKEMPPELFATMNAGAQEVAKSTSLAQQQFVAGFMSGRAGTPSWRWALVQVNKYPAGAVLPRNLRTALEADESKDIAAIKSAGFDAKILGSSIDGERGRRVIEMEMTVPAPGVNVHSRAVQQLGATSAVTLMGYATAEQWNNAEAEITAMQESLAFVSWADISNARRATGFNPGEIAYFAFGGVLLVLALLAAKRLKKA